MLYLGGDPGKSGAFGIIDHDGAVVQTIRMDETPLDVWDRLSNNDIKFGVIEKVHAMPRQGVSSTFKFGEAFGMMQGFIIAAGIPFEFVTPVTWQKALGCRSGGDKNVTKARAQALFPGTKIIHATADALLLAEYARRKYEGKL